MSSGDDSPERRQGTYYLRGARHRGTKVWSRTRKRDHVDGRRTPDIDSRRGRLFPYDGYYALSESPATTTKLLQRAVPGDVATVPAGGDCGVLEAESLSR